jgi:hypothetical protein
MREDPALLVALLEDINRGV